MLYLRMPYGKESIMQTTRLLEGEFYYARDVRKVYVGTNAGNLDLTNTLLSFHVIDPEAHPASSITIDTIIGLEAANVQEALEDLGIKVSNVITQATEHAGRLTVLEQDSQSLKNQTSNLENQVGELWVIVNEMDYRGLLESIEDWKQDTIEYVEDNYIINTQRGVPNGVATLGTDGIVPDSQLPETSIRTDIELLENKGEPNGYAPLDENSYVPNKHINPSIANTALANANDYTNTKFTEIENYVDESIDSTKVYVDTTVSNLKADVEQKVDTTVSDINDTVSKLSPFRYGQIMPILHASLGGSDGKRLVSRGVVDEKWVVCDGTNNTPNMIGRFIYGIDDPNRQGELGGSHQITLSEQHLPSHTHAGSYHAHTASGTTDAQGYHAHTFTAYTTATNNSNLPSAGNGGNYGTFSVNADGTHAHNVSGATSANGNEAWCGNTGGGQPIDILPPYVMVIYFMYVG